MQALTATPFATAQACKVCHHCARTRQRGKSEGRLAGRKNVEQARARVQTSIYPITGERIGDAARGRICVDVRPVRQIPWPTARRTERPVRRGVGMPCRAASRNIDKKKERFAQKGRWKRGGESTPPPPLHLHFHGGESIECHFGSYRWRRDTSTRHTSFLRNASCEMNLVAQAVNSGNGVLEVKSGTREPHDHRHNASPEK